LILAQGDEEMTIEQLDRKYRDALDTANRLTDAMAEVDDRLEKLHKMAEDGSLLQKEIYRLRMGVEDAMESMDLLGGWRKS
jgi:predicted  nucleic acid-binding Zn-ribbon protein